MLDKEPNTKSGGHVLRRNHTWVVLAFLLTVGPAAVAQNNASPQPPAWQSLFDGQSLSGWKVTDFAGHGDARVENGQITLGMGAALTGISWTNELPKTDYEITLEAMKVDGSDFFCGLTFPVKDSFCSFIVGGWGGGVVGLSSIDGQDASMNETTRYMSFDKGRWYRFHVRVSEAKIECWIDHEKVVDLVTTERKITLRYGEIELSKPLGIATWVTAAAVRDFRMRRLEPARAKKIVFIAGTKSHGPGEHEYEKGAKLLQHCLDTSPNIKGLRSEVIINGWPADEIALDDADSIVLYCDGADHEEKAHPLLRDNHLETMGNLMKSGIGLVAIHYTVFVPSQPAGERFLNWLGGYFDYENGAAANKWFSKIETKNYAVRPAAPTHAIARGLQAFELREEYYFNLRFLDNPKRWTPVLAFGADEQEKSAVVAWAVQRPDGGRGFGYTGGHFHQNWENENVRRLLLNAIVWTAKMDVPEDGVKSTLPKPNEVSAKPVPGK